MTHATGVCRHRQDQEFCGELPATLTSAGFTDQKLELVPLLSLQVKLC